MGEGWEAAGKAHSEGQLLRAGVVHSKVGQTLNLSRALQMTLQSLFLKLDPPSELTQYEMKQPAGGCREMEQWWDGGVISPLKGNAADITTSFAFASPTSAAVSPAPDIFIWTGSQCL